MTVPARAEINGPAHELANWTVAASCCLTLVLLIAFVVTLRAALRNASLLQQRQDDIASLHGSLPVLLLRIRIGADGSQQRSIIGGRLPGSMLDLGQGALSLAEWSLPDEPGAVDVGAAVTRALNDGYASGDYRVRTPEGSWEWLRIRLHRLHMAADGGRSEVIGYLSNVTAEREATRSLLACGRLSAMGELAAALVHEIRQPLAAISMASENAEDSLDAGDVQGVRRKLDKIVQQTRRANTLIEHLRRFARGGEMESPQPVRLDAMVDDAIEIAGGALRESGIALEVSLGDPPPTVLCQKVALEQVFVNLLVNARDIMASRPTNLPRRIRITSAIEAADSMATISFADTGGGIAPGVMRRLFEPFVTTKSANEGTGLGLAICRRLLDGMAGGITAMNSNEGAVFIISLPIAPADASASIEHAEQTNLRTPD